MIQSFRKYDNRHFIFGKVDVRMILGDYMKKTRLLTITMICFVLLYVLIVQQNYDWRYDSQKCFGVTYMTMNNPFYEVINSEIQKEVELRQDRLITLDPAMDIDKQIEQIQWMID